MTTNGMEDKDRGTMERINRGENIGDNSQSVY